MDFNITLAGPRSVTAGSDLYLTARTTAQRIEGLDDEQQYLTLLGADGPAPAHILTSYNTTAADVDDSPVDGQGRQRVWKGVASAFTIRLRVPPDLFGWYEAVIRVAGLHVEKAVPWRFQVLPPIAVQPRAADPTIAEWERQMLTLGKRWADWVKDNPLQFGVESQPWYYDGGRVYLQIAQYTRDPRWLEPAETILKQYAKYVIDNDGRIAPHRKFPFGLLLNWQRTGDPVSRDALARLYGSVSDAYLNAAAPCRGELYSGQRELAYAVDCMVAGERAGLGRSKFLYLAVDGMLGLCDQLYDSNPMGMQNQTFYGGLMAEALIEYYDLTGDPRVERALSKLLQWYAAHAIQSRTGAMLYSLSENPLEYITDLNNLIAPAYVWHGDRFRDADSLAIGKFLFQHSLDSDISYSGKIFCQNYKWSFMMVEILRKGQ